MSECINKRLGERLYAYELGMLNDADRDEFEVHLLECDFCRAEAESFLPTVSLLTDDSQTRDRVSELVGENAPAAESSITPVRGKHRTLWQTVVAVAAVLAILILRPWGIHFDTADDVTASENRVAVMYFDNLSGDESADRLGEFVTALLITDLSESHYLRVLSDQRLRDIRRLLEIEGVSAMDVGLPKLIAERANARWLITGSVLQTEPEIVIDVRLVEAATGDVIASHRLTAPDETGLFPAIDSLTVLVKADFDLPAASFSEPDPAVADVTTSSPEAYRYYLRGLELYSMYYFDEAQASFLKALEFDSTFAMAYYCLSWLGDISLNEKAVYYAQKATRKERLFILSRKADLNDQDSLATAYLEQLVAEYPDEKVAWMELAYGRYVVGDYDTAIEYLHNSLRADPLYRDAWNWLCYSYDARGEYDSALYAINHLLEYAPNEANPYHSKADLLARHGQADEALALLKRAAEIKPDFLNGLLLLSIGRMYVHTLEYDSAHA
ncbi:MAG: tetratricopeptide repeat protein, partial [candidate division Zixibacteria bacterium]|nr:tetratricopeptide repeat protein [candidate division Zixibacteria bacterium]